MCGEERFSLENDSNLTHLYTCKERNFYSFDHRGKINMFTGDTPPMKLFLILYQTDLMGVRTTTIRKVYGNILRRNLVLSLIPIKN